MLKLGPYVDLFFAICYHMLDNIWATYNLVVFENTLHMGHIWAAYGPHMGCPYVAHMWPICFGRSSTSGGVTGREADLVRKDMVDLFKKLGLWITIDTNLKIVNFLDLTLNLNYGKYYPFRKPNDTPLYINRMSNHPPAIIRKLPAEISRRLTDISHDEVFDNAAPLYNNALKRSGYSESAT